MSVRSRVRGLWLLWTERAFVFPAPREWGDDYTAWGDRCEICGGTDVMRSGEWDYCALGHAYVGKRAQR